MAAFTFLLAHKIYLESAPAVVQSFQFSTTLCLLIYKALCIFIVRGYCVIVLTFRAEMAIMFFPTFFDCMSLAYIKLIYTTCIIYNVNRNLYLLSNINPRLNGWLQTRPTTVSLSSLTDNTLSHKGSPLNINLINIIIIDYNKRLIIHSLKSPFPSSGIIENTPLDLDLHVIVYASLVHLDKCHLSNNLLFCLMFYSISDM